MSLAGEFGYGRSRVPPFDSIDFASFSNWHKTNAYSLAVSAFPTFYSYVFDGSPSTIYDGGFNMWNEGNIVSFGATTVPYGTIGSNYFVSEANVWPQVALGFTTAAAVAEWKNSGNLGMAGSPFGSNANFSGTYTTPNQGRGGSYWVNQKYGLTNPTVCYLWFTITQPTINTIATGSNDNRSTPDPPLYSYTQSVSVTGSKIILGQMFLSTRSATSFPNGDLISQVAVEGFLSNYVRNADIRMI
jgi:hypothetical protein